MSVWTKAAFCVGVQVLLVCSCARRRFNTEEAAVQQLRTHQEAYRALAEDWLVSGHTDLYWFDRSSSGQAAYTWDDYKVASAAMQRWRITHWDGHEYTEQFAQSFGEAATICGTTGEEILKWHGRLEALSADKIRRVSFQNGRNWLNYVEIGYFPELETYGFLFAQSDDHATQELLRNWAKRPQHVGQRIDALGDEWFYFEGHWGSDSQ